MRWITGLVLLVALVPSLVSAQTPEASPEVGPVSVFCEGWGEYREAVSDALLPVSDSEKDAMSRVLDKSIEDYSAIPTATLVTASHYMDGYASRLDAIKDVPSPLEPFHDLYIGRVVLLSRVMTASAEGDVLALGFYIDQLAKNENGIKGQVRIWSDTCPNAWIILTHHDPTAFPLMWQDWEISPQSD